MSFAGYLTVIQGCKKVDSCYKICCSVVLGVEEPVIVNAGQSEVLQHKMPCAESLVQSSESLTEETVIARHTLAQELGILFFFFNVVYTSPTINIINCFTKVF